MEYSRKIILIHDKIHLNETRYENEERADISNVKCNANAEK